MSNMTGQALVDLNKKFDSFFTLLKEMDDRLFTASNQIQNIDHCLCNIESTLKVDSATHRDIYFNTSNPDKEEGPSADWEIGQEESPNFGFNSHNAYNKHRFGKPPTEINLEQDEMTTDELDLTRSLEQSLTALDETKSALHDAKSENAKLQADIAELRLNFVSMQNEISRLSSNPSQ